MPATPMTNSRYRHKTNVTKRKNCRTSAHSVAKQMQAQVFICKLQARVKKLEELEAVGGLSGVATCRFPPEFTI